MERATQRAQDVVVVPDADRLAHVAAERFAGSAETAVARAGRFTVALAGGSTPKGLYSVLAKEPYRTRIPWRHTHVFWGDERCVPTEHEESNYRMATETLLRHVPVPPMQIHRMRGEDAHPDQAAADYERVLKTTFGLPAGGLPRFDLILLGMGADGHTASLFPGSPALRETTRLVVAPYVERRGYRITLTLPALNEASRIFFLVSGQDKAAVLHSVLDAATREDRLPAGLVCPRGGSVSWFVDSAAAYLLARSRPRGAAP